MSGARIYILGVKEGTWEGFTATYGYKRLLTLKAEFKDLEMEDDYSA
jgi:hypothetical protein